MVYCVSGSLRPGLPHQVVLGSGGGGSHAPLPHVFEENEEDDGDEENEVECSDCQQGRIDPVLEAQTRTHPSYLSSLANYGIIQTF